MSEFSPLRRRLAQSPVVRAAVVARRHAGIAADDVFLVSYPRSGNTWLKFMIAHLLTGEEVGFDRSEELVPPVGMHARAPRLTPAGGRVVKSHEPYRRLHGRAYRTVVYLARDGRDVAVSYYFHQIRRDFFSGEFGDFLTHFLRGDVEGYGAWHDHVESWLARPRAARTLVVRYEDLLADTPAELARVAEFLGAPADDAALRAVVESNTASRMRSKEDDSQLLTRRKRNDVPFVRRAAAGTWTEAFGDDELDRFERVAGAALSRLGYELHARWPPRAPGAGA